jgi:glycosyltransferase involved in cell wall biosynthesis
MKNLAIFTIVSSNYLHFARTLLQTAVAHHPEADCYCVIVDRDLSHARKLNQEFQVISLNELALPDGDDFLFQYTILELNTAVKPWAIQHLIEKGYEKVFYIDPDIQIYQPLNEVKTLLETDADIVLTPHLLAPVTDTYRPGEVDIRMAGTYNLGFCAVRGSSNTLQFLKWWQGKLARDCIVAQDRGIFVDQSWIDLVPGLFPNVAVLRHPGYNVAYWNIAQRNVAQSGNGLMVENHHLVFFHFSGLNPLEPRNLSKHQNRFTLDNLPELVRALVLDYCNSVVANGISHYSKLPYGYETYTEGEKITELARRRFRTSDELRRLCKGNPFAHAKLMEQFARHSAMSDSTMIDELHYTLGGRRLASIFQKLLGRNPDASAIKTFSRQCDSKAGTVRTILAVGLSAEARANPGWETRLLSFGSESPHTPALITRLAISPLLKIFKRRNPIQISVLAAPDLTATEPVPAPRSPAEGKRRSQLAPHGKTERLPAPLGINLVGYLAAELGVGEAARSLARACLAVKVPFSAVDVGYQTQNLQRDTDILGMASADRYPIDLLYVNADQTPAIAAKLREDKLTSEYTIGFWHWEQPELPTRLLGAFAHVDEVWVPSTFVHDAVAAVSPVPVFKIPHALQFSPTAGIQRSHFNLPSDKLLVLVMYDFHSYQYRKNPAAAIAAFRLAAAKNNDLALVIKTINSEHHADAYAELGAHVQDLPNVIFINEFLTRQQTWDLQACCDILLSLHRAEGFGLAPAEMMYLGKAVVATGWSANMDFMTQENSMPVRFELKPLTQDIGAYSAGPVWAEADVDHAAYCIHEIANSPGLMLKLGHKAATDVRNQLSPAKVGGLINSRLKILGHWYPHLLV